MGTKELARFFKLASLANDETIRRHMPAFGPSLASDGKFTIKFVANLLEVMTSTDEERRQQRESELKGMRAFMRTFE